MSLHLTRKLHSRGIKARKFLMKKLNFNKLKTRKVSVPKLNNMFTKLNKLVKKIKTKRQSRANKTRNIKHRGG
jgi:hypothetical protein|tara:strand:- start:431 stop:649 length:219 start_codon:yes stop_codon:yes gene_type:complete